MEADIVNWNQLAAQSTVIIGAGAIIARLLWSKVDALIDKKINESEEKLEEKIDTMFQRVKDKQTKDKEQIFSDINGMGTKLQQMDKQLALQMAIDDRHDKELTEGRSQHKDLDTRFNAVVEKIFLRIEEVKDLIMTNYTREK